MSASTAIPEWSDYDIQVAAFRRYVTDPDFAAVVDTAVAVAKNGHGGEVGQHDMPVRSAAAALIISELHSGSDRA